MDKITKSFPGVLANDRITFKVKTGEIHALLGENGAGKTTLMNLLYGMYQPDQGQIYVFGKNVRIRSPKDAIRLGIGMVHQHFMLVGRLTVVENIILGKRSPHWPFLNLQEAKMELEKLSAQYHFNIDMEAQVWQLSVGMQQRVEILKILFQQARLLILDEPTSILTPQETEEFITILKNLSAKGLSIIFISHKLEEVMSLCDRITVLRNGKVIDTVHTKDVNKAVLAQMMVGRDVLFRTVRSKHTLGKIILDVEKLSATNNKGLHALKDVSFKIHEGEIFGIAGVDGNGQTELAEVIAGLKRPVRGKIRVQGVDATHFEGVKRQQLGIGYIPEDRHKTGLVRRFSVWENMILKVASSARFTYKGIYFNFREIRKALKKMIYLFDIRGPNPEGPVENYSGGNQQKVILAREFDLKPILLIAAQPTRGLDVGAIEYVHGQLMDFVRQGNVILLISTELEEILALSHRFAVIYEGELLGTVDNESQIDLSEIGLMMAGSKRSYNGA